MSHPYVIAPNHIRDIISRLRSNFMKEISTDTLKKMGIAPTNESYVVRSLQFLNLFDDTGKRNEEMVKLLSSEGEEFEAGFAEIVKSAYTQLFDSYGEDAWTLDDTKLRIFFRQADGASQSMGKLKAITFKVFAELSGKIEKPPHTETEKRKLTSKVSSRNTARKSAAKPPALKKKNTGYTVAGDLGVKIRLNINLPADASRETYDAIFASIRESLLRMDDE